MRTLAGDNKGPQINEDWPKIVNEIWMCSKDQDTTKVTQNYSNPEKL